MLYDYDEAIDQFLDNMEFLLNWDNEVIEFNRLHSVTK